MIRVGLGSRGLGDAIRGLGGGRNCLLCFMGLINIY